MRTGPGVRDSGMQRSAAQIAAAASGTLRKKIARHDQAVMSQPPSSGPIAVVTPERPAQAPIAGPCSSSAKLARRTARLPGTSSAAPAPCTARAAISAPREGARPQAIEATVNQTSPTTNVFRRPSPSPRDPPSSSSEVSVSRNASIVHCSPAMPACSSRPRTGSATLITVESRNAMPEPRTVASSTPRPRAVRRPMVTAAGLWARRIGRAARTTPGRAARAAPRGPRPPG